MPEYGHELSERKKQLLKAIVEVHIRRGDPVGSKFLIQDMQSSLSSATIRNEMAELESLGYLEQPHTSAGRIPSRKGYRLYVDCLMRGYTPTGSEREKIASLEHTKQEELDSILRDASRIASVLTEYAAFYIKARPLDLCVKRFDLVLTDAYRFLLVMTFAGGRVVTKSIRLTFPIDSHVLRRLALLRNQYVAGRRMRQITVPVIVKMESEMGVYNVLITPLLKSIYGAMRDLESGDIRFEGLNRLLRYPEFADPVRIRSLFDMMDSREEFLDMLESADASCVNVIIGNDTGIDSIDNSALVFYSLQRGGEVLGAVGVIGPYRMPYEKVVALVGEIGRTVEQMLADEGLRPGLPGREG